MAPRPSPLQPATHRVYGPCPFEGCDEPSSVAWIHQPPARVHGAYSGGTGACLFLIEHHPFGSTEPYPPGGGRR